MDKPLPSFFMVYPMEPDILSVADRLTAMDDLEARMMSGTSSREAMLISVRRSEEMGGLCMVGYIDGKPELVCGISRDNLLSDHGQIWMLRTDETEKHPIKYGKYSKRVMRSLIRDSGCTYLENWCLAENERSIRWLKWLGFTFDRDMTMGGHVWRHFYIIAGDDHGSSGRA